MEYKKIENKNYNLHILKTDKFKTIKVKINFKRKIKKEEITKRIILNDLLINTSKKYKQTREIEIKTEELYSLNISSNPYKSGNYHIMSFTTTFLNEKYTEENMNYESINFMLDLIFEPNILDNKFDSKYFGLIKKIIENDIMSIKDDPKKYSLTRLYEEMDNGPLSYRSDGYLEDLDKITEKNLYDYYKTVIENDKIDIFIIGDIDEKINELFINKIPNTIRIEDKISHYLDMDITKEKEVIEKMNINQSQLLIGIKSKNLTDFELKYVLSIYSLILGGTPNARLFQNVREKNSLCYTIGSSTSILSKMITINAGINGRDYKKTLSLIKNEINEIKRGNITDEEISEAKKIYIAGCNKINDSAESIISNYLSREYASLDLVEKRIIEVDKVTKENVKEISNKLFIDRIFLLEGTKQDEENTTI